MGRDGGLRPGVALVADMVALPWHRYSLDLSAQRFGVEVPSFRIDRTAVQNPFALLGIAAMVVAVLMVAATVGPKLWPSLPRPGPLHLVGGAVLLGLVVAKLLAENDFLGSGAYLGTVLAALVAYGGLVLSQEAAAERARQATARPARSAPDERVAGFTGQPFGAEPPRFPPGETDDGRRG